MGLPLGRDGFEGLLQQPDYGGGRRDMQVNNSEFKPKIVAFCCNWCSYAGADRGHQPFKLIRGCEDHPRPLLLPREPHVHPAGFQRGADGVILCGCHPGDCHYTTGNYYTRRRATLLFSMLDYLGIEKGGRGWNGFPPLRARIRRHHERLCGNRNQTRREQEIGGIYDAKRNDRARQGASADDRQPCHRMEGRRV